MRHLLLCMTFVASLLLAPFSQAASAQSTDSLTAAMLNGKSAILIDAATGTVLFEKNAHAPMYPASITKIATGIYAIENGNPDDIVTVSKNARYVEGTRVYLGEGEQVTLRKLEYGLLMHSGNDAAIAIAEHMAGSVEAFAERLNDFLQEKVGVTETHFTNPHGLHDPDHYTTAADMAKIAQYAMKNPTFRAIAGTVRLPWDGREWKSELINHNKLLRDYEGATGIKNGFTDQAGHTLVGSAKRGETELIAVTMKTDSSNASYKDVTTMLDYGFAHFETKLVAKKGEVRAASKPFIVPEDAYITVPLGTTVQEQVTEQGELVVTAGDHQYRFPLEPKEIHPPPAPAKPDVKQPEQAGSAFLRYAVWAFLLLIALFVLYAAARTKKRRKALKINRYHRERDWGL
ncbi:D-alanyl-D-alanine carboxypeptidase [Brevibacillus sp. SYP-B805]|uniref:D-alanyl-D-alanine carboxypeptidase family protein n=1 Tax=Brevibacillus sp. SYP-B805 TaxID=1578199 RepID=UPI0013E9F0D6|nr:D-alanyl-D-alanine carboxypeptidase family protein [Brevibacillus sp. SYP-B805]NGQ95751.1 D-alanyl-D-alanine carboxypeptidase [Brevibacillus sp. SYP-B805]